ncbi:uncharacterized protein LOC129594027 [Paramacrobiotus metropolitanus]|uniref:uncharacterized protein LOC129594027 n=1 Tax=Paramacrobiotus metropolitanus TaxID=2943436 RepID=UPI0024464D96|nr:uncharacterized protein LOC129594027 [Paramacrobiotus metropolitanus]
MASSSIIPAAFGTATPATVPVSSNHNATSSASNRLLTLDNFLSTTAVTTTTISLMNSTSAAATAVYSYIGIHASAPRLHGNSPSPVNTSIRTNTARPEVQQEPGNNSIRSSRRDGSATANNTVIPTIILNNVSYVHGGGNRTDGGSDGKNNNVSVVGTATSSASLLLSPAEFSVVTTTNPATTSDATTAATVYNLSCPPCLLVGAEIRRGMALDQFATAGISVGVIILVAIIVICVLWKRGFRLGRVGGVGAASGGGANVNLNSRSNNPRVPPQQDSAFTPIFNRSRPLRPQQNHSFSPTFSTSRPRHMPTPRSSPLAFLFSRQHRPPTDAPPPPPPPPQQHEAVIHYNPEYNGLPGNEENGHAGGMGGSPGDDRIYQNVELNIVPNREECRGSRNLLDFGLDSSNNSSNNLASNQGISAVSEEEEAANRRPHRNSSYSTYSGSPSTPLRHDTSYRVSAEGFRLPSQMARSQDRSSISGVHGMESIEEQQDEAPDVYLPSSGVADGEEEMWEEDDVGDDDAADFESEAGEHGYDGGSGSRDDGRGYDFPPPPSDEVPPPPGRPGRGGRRRRNGGGGVRAWGREAGRRLERHGE